MLAVLALAAAAVVAGMTGYAAITGWVADVPAAVLTDLYLRSGAAAAPPPSKSTIWRVLTDTGPDAFDAAVGTWLMGLAGVAGQPAGAAGGEGGQPLMQVGLDGKTIRGRWTLTRPSGTCSPRSPARMPPPRWPPLRPRPARRR